MDRLPAGIDPNVMEVNPMTEEELFQLQREKMEARENDGRAMVLEMQNDSVDKKTAPERFSASRQRRMSIDGQSAKRRKIEPDNGKSLDESAIKGGSTAHAEFQALDQNGFQRLPRSTDLPQNSSDGEDSFSELTTMQDCGFLQRQPSKESTLDGLREQRSFDIFSQQDQMNMMILEELEQNEQRRLVADRFTQSSIQSQLQNVPTNNISHTQRLEKLEQLRKRAVGLTSITNTAVLQMQPSSTEPIDNGNQTTPILDEVAYRRQQAFLQRELQQGRQPAPTQEKRVVSQPLVSAVNKASLHPITNFSISHQERARLQQEMARITMAAKQRPISNHLSQQQQMTTFNLGLSSQPQPSNPFHLKWPASTADSSDNDRKRLIGNKLARQRQQRTFTTRSPKKAELDGSVVQNQQMRATEFVEKQQERLHEHVDEDIPECTIGTEGMTFPFFLPKL
jgi:hypothetical protein